MIIYNGTYSWEGWGGRLKLASGTCSLKIFNLKDENTTDLAHLRPIIVIVSDLPGNKVSVKSCAGHIATKVTHDFSIDPQRMLWIEHYPAVEYGTGSVKKIPERFEAVEFTWHDNKAIDPKWRLLKPPILDSVIKLLRD